MSRASKRSKSIPCATASLPEEIISEILLLLPSRSILRFRAVCRSWVVLLSSPSFKDTYAAKADARARRADKFVFFAPSIAWPNQSTVAYSCARGTTTVADPLFTIDRVRADYMCLSSRPCHGAMLFSDTRSGTYWVCNPSTGERTPLPKQHRGLTESSAGLVYDDWTRQHKVVHLFLKDTALQCEIYTLCNPGRQWRPANKHIELVGTENMIKLVKALQTEDSVTKVPPVFANGWLHWLVYPNSTDIQAEPAGRDAIVCFSVAMETFALINAPANVHVAEYRELDENLPAVPMHLSELEGSVCLLHDLRRRGQGRSWLDVWILRDHAASEWSLDYRIDATPLLARDVHFSPGFITVLGCCCGGSGGGVGNKQDKKKILIATSQHQVHAYDPDTGDIQLALSVPESGICASASQKDQALRLVLYEDSLVRIGGESYQDKQVLLALTKILVRLPIKSIAQCMLVCRKWCSLIENESFVTAHTSVKRPRRILMANNGRAQRAFFDFAPVEYWLQAVGPALAGILVNEKMICSKPCHGLNLISTSTDDFLCNPCTGAIRCLGRLGKSHFTPTGHDRRHAFSVGRSIGFGFDQSTGEHVAVEIGYIRGSLACMIKTSSEKQWSCIGKPPRQVSDDMPPAHVNGTLYWMSETRHERAIVAFEISTKAFCIIACEPCLYDDDCNAFLVELNGALSLVAVDTTTEDMDIWKMDKHGSSWVHSYKIRLDDHPDYSLKTGKVVMPVDIDSKYARILLNTGRALGYYDTRTGALDNLYSMDHLKLPQNSLAFPILCQESLVCVQEDELPNRAAPAAARHEGCRRCDHPEHADATLGRGRPVLPKCEAGACVDIGVFYRSCCRRLLCMSCQIRCLVHSPTHIIRRDPILPTSDFDVTMVSLDSTLPFCHPSVPGPEFCYYYTTKDGDVVRHVFISLSDHVRSKRFSHQTECGYRMEGKAVKESWVRRYLKL